MTIAPGSRLGPYEITAKLGEGGMGEVYRATDTRLDRQVAIKVLPAAFTADAERLARFEREAKLLAQLHHPHIASVFGLEETDGVRALVMELVEGNELTQLIARGPLPVGEALAIARQIAEALEAAHERGIVHRDLKPANVKVQTDGTVKVLDFGLAKAMDASTGSSGADLARSPTLMNSPTLTAAGTQLGVILGTAAYMAPEQARGGAVDKRADIWAFGVVLYEMLTGRSLFAGDTVSDTLAGVLKNPVDLDAFSADVPASVRQLLRRCLERNPKNRLHDIADARLLIDDALAGRVDITAASASPAGTSPSRWRIAAPIVLAAGLALGATAGWMLRGRPAPSAAAGARLALALPEGTPLSTANYPQIAISRDGRQQVISVAKGGTTALLLRRDDAFEPVLLPGTEGAVEPFFSPDGAWIGFVREDALMKMPVTGGPSIRLATISNAGRGATWSSDGHVYFTGSSGLPLSRVRESGGGVEEVTHLDAVRDERTHRWPDALPGGEAVLFTSDTQSSTEYYDDARIEAVRPATGERKVLIEGASQARYAPGGYLVFARDGALYAVRFDPHSLTVSGAPVEVVRGVATNVGSGAVQFAISESGVAVWVPGSPTASYRIEWVGADGREEPLALPDVPYQELALAPDGKRLALVGGQGGSADLWVADLERGGIARLTSGAYMRSPLWSHDGARIAYGTFSTGETEAQSHLEWRAADGSGPAEVLVADKRGCAPSDFLRDGRDLLFDFGQAFPQAGGVMKLTLAGERQKTALTHGQSLESDAVVSPDGKWMAYASSESGTIGVYVTPYPQGGARWPVSQPQGWEPRWSPDGRHLYYVSDATLYRVAIDSSHGFSAGRPEAVLDRVASGQTVHTYALSADGSRILTFRSAAGNSAQREVYLDQGFARRLDELAGGKH